MPRRARPAGAAAGEQGGDEEQGAAASGRDAAQTVGLPYDIDPVSELEFELDPEPMLGQFPSEWAGGVLGVVGVVGVVVAAGVLPVEAEFPPDAASAPPAPAASTPQAASIAITVRGEMALPPFSLREEDHPHLRFP